jgi:hypothetical protein
MPKLGEASEAAHDLILEHVTDELAGGYDFEESAKVALSTMLMALLAAFGALMAGISAQEALLDRTAEITDASVRESDRITLEVLRAKHEILESMGEMPDPTEQAHVAAHEREMLSYADRAAEEEESVQALVFPHLVFAITVTLLSVGIALNGVAVVTRRRSLWFIGMALGGLGAFGVLLGVILFAVL